MIDEYYIIGSHMCGICGFAGFQDSALLRQMTGLLRHRGPDDDGFHETPTASLGARRLSIIDIAGGHQPLYNEDRSVAVVQNGEIFNYQELQKDLIARGHQLKTQCDTEVLAHLYEIYGADFCVPLNGDFGIALWDQTQQRLLLARDRFGVHALYYTVRNGQLVFASEIKSLLAWKGIDRTLDPAAIDAYLSLRYVPEERTFFKHIHRVPPGSLLTFHRGDMTIKPYWSLPADRRTRSVSLDAAADELHALLKDSVNLRLRADVPVGAYLSGGLDSNLIVGLMRELKTGPIKTFSIGFGLANDELTQAKATAEREKTEHYEILIGQKDYELLPKIVWHLDEPIGDSIIIPNYRLSQAAAQKVKVVTSGEGADEVWGGYIHHLALRSIGTLDRMLPNGWSTLLANVMNVFPTGLIDKIFPYPAALGNQGRDVFLGFLKNHANKHFGEDYLALASLYRTHDKREMYSSDFAASLAPEPSLASRFDSYFQPGQSLLQKAIQVDMKNWLPNYTLFRQDKIGFANSLEIRVPYLDHRIVEFAAGLPDRFKIQGTTTKRLLRMAAAKTLPPQLAGKRKQAFYFPVQDVFGKGYHQFMTDVLGSRKSLERGIFRSAFIQNSLNTLGSQEMLQNKRLMALLVLELWFQTFVDQNGLSPLPTT